MKKNLFILIGIVFFIVLVTILARFVIEKGKDTWLCKNAKWICGVPTISQFQKLPFEPVKKNIPDEQYITVMYQPVQCESTPWDEWYVKGEIKFIKEPSEEDIIKLYYNTKEKMILKNVKRVDLQNVCEACNICPKSYYFTADILVPDVEKILKLGWKNVN